MKKFWVTATFCLMGAILAGCTFPGSTPTAPTTDPSSILTAAAGTAYVKLTNVALQATATPSPAPSDTPVPVSTEVLLPTSIPTITPILGQVLGNANVRGIPQKSKTHDLGGVMQGQSVQVIARNDTAEWLNIIFANSPTGTGWVLARAIRLHGDITTLPIVIYPNGFDAASIMLPALVFPTVEIPQAPSTPQADWSKYGTLVQPANVRAGPSVGYVTVSILNPGTLVTFSGKTSDGTWVQIEFPSGPEGHGWILAALVQAHDGFGGLTLYNYLATPVTPTPKGGAPTATSGNGPDSTAAPADTSTPPAPTAPPLSASGIATGQLNVRSGPSGFFQVTGTLNANDKLVITGRTISGLWYQIEYPAGPGGLGWVSSQYVKITGDMSHVPFYYNEGTQVPQ